MHQILTPFSWDIYRKCKTHIPGSRLHILRSISMQNCRLYVVKSVFPNRLCVLTTLQNYCLPDLRKFHWACDNIYKYKSGKRDLHYLKM